MERSKEEKDFIQSLRLKSFHVVYILRNEQVRRNYVCFSGLVNLSSADPFILFASKEKEKNTLLQRNNYVILNDNQIKEHLSFVAETFGGITNFEINEKEVSVNIDFSTMKHTDTRAHRLTILTLIRYIFEHPYAQILEKAFELRGKHGKYSLMEWLLIAHTTMVYGYNHCLCEAHDNDVRYENNRIIAEQLKIYLKFDLDVYAKTLNTESNNKIFEEMPKYNTQEIHEIEEMLK